jgi:aminocarboxymuconate-semialdehyde decarboxylase
MGAIPGAEQRSTAADTFRRLYWDTALSWTDPVLRLLRSTVGLSQVLFGTDYPYLRRDLAVSTRQRLLDSPELDAADRTNILGATATKLIPRLGLRPAV